tara:strand:- start:42 stop:338 length:297 start_codon:yes stop_codon:yes gene_type:complete
MLESPDAVLVYIPLMKGLGMSWKEIKHTPRMELDALLSAMYEYETFHSMDGYSDNDVSQMAKDRPEIRNNYRRYLETRRKYEDMLGKKEVKDFSEVFK